MASASRFFFKAALAVRLPFARPAPRLFKAQYRAFSVSWRQAMLSTELSEKEVSSLRANKDRLAKDLHNSCQWGPGIRWGE